MIKTLKSTISFFSIPMVFSSTLALISTLGIVPTSAVPKSDITTFACIPQGENYATIAKRANRTTPPIIVWKDTSFGPKYPPQKRCEIVSNRLSQAVAAQKGRLKTLRLTHGMVGSNSVICYINHPQERCDKKNTLLTLKPEDRGQETAIIEQLVSLKVTQQPLSRGPGQPDEKRAVVSFGDAIEKALTPDTMPVTPTSPSPSPTVL
jgi:hypothetical protein